MNVELERSGRDIVCYQNELHMEATACDPRHLRPVAFLMFSTVPIDPRGRAQSIKVSLKLETLRRNINHLAVENIALVSLAIFWLVHTCSVCKPLQIL
jgi:hypothetical protein